MVVGKINFVKKLALLLHGYSNFTISYKSNDLVVNS